MKILNVIKTEVFLVETDEEEFFQYTRYGPESWTVRMGDSDEPVYESGELEREFQNQIH